MTGKLVPTLAMAYLLLGSLVTAWSWRRSKDRDQDALWASIEQVKKGGRPVPARAVAEALGSGIALVVATLFWPVVLVNRLRRTRAPVHAKPVRPIRVLRQPPTDTDDGSASLIAPQSQSSSPTTNTGEPMLTLHDDRMRFAFPQVHRHAHCEIELMRTLRIPDDDQSFPLPPRYQLPLQFGRFPVRAVDDHLKQVPPDWARHGGVFMPMYQSEALWVSLYSLQKAIQQKLRMNDDGPRYAYPCAVKIATGKVNAISGEPWCNGLHADSQDYVVIPNQRWLDGYNVAKGLVRQFVATPLGSGHSVESQRSGRAEHGGLQIAVYPMKAEVYEAYCRRRAEQEAEAHRVWIRNGRIRLSIDRSHQVELSAGGLIRQAITKDPHGIDAWDQEHVSRCFVHLLNSEHYRSVTGERPPHIPFSARDYAKAGLPWFHCYSDGEALEGAAPLAKVNSVAAVTAAQTGQPMADNAPLGPLPVRMIGEETVCQEPF
jgi:hypothetical protein